MSGIRKRIGVGLAAVVTTLGVGAIVTSPVQAVADKAPANAACPIATGAEWNARNPNKQKAVDLGELVPGVNAGPIGTDVACMPVPALDYAGTAAFHKSRPDLAKVKKPKHVPDAKSERSVATGGQRGESVPMAKRRTACNGTGECWWYAAASQGSLTATSHTWTQRVAKPGLGSDGLGGGHTLAEGSVQRASAAGGTNIVELGTTVDPGICGSTGASPCIFVFSWTPAPQWYNGGAWVNVSGCNPCMGTSVTSWVGTSKTFSLSYISSPTAQWCASANSQYVACIPASTWTSNEFTSGSQIQEWFEVAVVTKTEPNTDMGDATLANCSTPAGSYFINSKVNGVNANLNTYNSAIGGGVVDTTKYNSCLMPTYTNYWRGGGPGWPTTP